MSDDDPEPYLTIEWLKEDAPSRRRRSTDPADWPVLVIWTWLPRIGWMSQRHASSDLAAVTGRAEAWERFLTVECRLPNVVEVRDEAEGEPQYVPQVPPTLS